MRLENKSNFFEIIFYGFAENRISTKVNPQKINNELIIN